jgi:hypothetical protein
MKKLQKGNESGSDSEASGVMVAASIATSNISRKHALCFAGIVFIFLTGTSIAAPFQNLDFEQAVIQPPPTNYVPFDAFLPIDAAAALPFWTAREDTSTLTALWGAPVALDETSVALVSTNSIVVDSPKPLQERFSIAMTCWSGAFAPYYRTASISQVGDVPVGSRSVEFLVGSGIRQPTVSLNGSVLRTFKQSATTLVADVSAFAGTTAELKFECNGTGYFMGENSFYLDGISFSPNPIPVLSIVPSSTNLLICWSASLTNYVLETTPSLSAPATWTTVTKLSIKVTDCSVWQLLQHQAKPSSDCEVIKKRASRSSPMLDVRCSISVFRSPGTRVGLKSEAILYRFIVGQLCDSISKSNAEAALIKLHLASEVVTLLAIVGCLEDRITAPL